MSPVIPHFANECLEIIGVKDDIFWPKINKKLLIEEKINFVIQINGKTREIINSDKDTKEDELLIKAKESVKLKNYFKDKKIIKKIFVPKKLINIITK